MPSISVSLQLEMQIRGRATVPRLALVGYANAGKSTLMNVLCPEA